MRDPSCRLLLVVCLVLVTAGTGVRGNWFDTEDMQLFDLVEEVNGTFYEFMNLNRSATPAEVRKAFRVLSLKLHPDKSDDPEAEAKFRQLVSISEVLKDEAKRQKYEQVLEHGLPDWRSGIYYIRRARKLGLLEMSILVSLITTVGHYLCLVAAYYEKVFEVKEMIRRKEKKLKQAEYDLLFEEVMQVNGVVRPKIGRDNLLLRTTQFVYRLFFTHIPVTAAHSVELLKTHFQTKVEEQEFHEPQVVPRVKKVRTKQVLPDLTGQDSDDDGDDSCNQSTEAKKTQESSASVFKSDEWSQDEILLLIKMTKKFPSGTTQRWERIATAIGRAADDVIKMSNIITRSIRTGEVRVAEPIATAAKQAVSVSTNDISRREPVDLSANSEQNWSQAEQKLLEEGLQKFPRGLEDRWDRIAEHTGKTKEECVLRFRWLADLVKRKKTQTNGSA